VFLIFSVLAIPKRQLQTCVILYRSINAPSISYHFLKTNAQTTQFSAKANAIFHNSHSFISILTSTIATPHSGDSIHAGVVAWPWMLRPAEEEKSMVWIILSAGISLASGIVVLLLVVVSSTIVSVAEIGLFSSERSEFVGVSEREKVWTYSQSRGMSRIIYEINISVPFESFTSSENFSKDVSSFDLITWLQDLWTSRD
jgi:hypothetical protein